MFVHRQVAQRIKRQGRTQTSPRHHMQVGPPTVLTSGLAKACSIDSSVLRGPTKDIHSVSVCLLLTPPRGRTVHDSWVAAHLQGVGSEMHIVCRGQGAVPGRFFFPRTARPTRRSPQDGHHEFSFQRAPNRNRPSKRRLVLLPGAR